MSLVDRLNAYSRRPTATVTIGGKRWRSILSLSRDVTFGQGISVGGLVGRDPPVDIVEEVTEVSWTWGYDGYEIAGFNGIVTEILQKSYPNQWSLVLADPLRKADIRSSDIAVDPLNNVTASAAITQILSNAGISRLTIEPLIASGSAWAGNEWMLGTLTPIAWQNTTALQAAQQIASTLGYWLYCDYSGVVRILLMERGPSDSLYRTLTWGKDFLLDGAPDRKRDASSVKNRIVVRGANTGVQGAQIHDAWQTGAADKTLEFQSFLLEYMNESEAGVASLAGVAQRLLKLHGRQPNIINISKLKADPRLMVGHTLGIVCPPIGYNTVRSFFLYGLSTKLDFTSGQFSQSLVLDGGIGDGGYTTLPPPQASFTYTLASEGWNGTSVIEVFLDGSSSIAFSDGDIVNYTWTTSNTVVAGTPSTASGVKAVMIFPATAGSVDITLTVSDTLSKNGSITQTIPLIIDTSTVKRVLSIAGGSAWVTSPDGGVTWNTYNAGDSTLVPEIGSTSLISTTGSGGTSLVITNDILTSTPTPGVNAGGVITALSQTLDNATRTWIAVGNTLYRSLDGGLTKAEWATAGGTINGVLEDPAVLNSVFVLVGPNVMHSTTGGTFSVVLYAGPAGATARQLVRGRSGTLTWIAYTGTFTGSPLQRIEGGISVTFPEVSPAVSEIRAIALSDNEIHLYAWDQAGRIWSINADDGLNVTLSTQSHPAGETVMHALHDPELDVIYVASFASGGGGTVRKFLPSADYLALFYQMASGQQPHRIGIGANVPAVAEVLLLTRGQDPGGVYHYVGGWVLKNNGLPTGWTWRKIATNPLNPDDWLLVGDNGVLIENTGGFFTSAGHPVVYRTLDAGMTWSSIQMQELSLRPTSMPFFVHGNIGYTSQNKLFIVTLLEGDGDHAVVWTGTTVLTPVAYELDGGTNQARVPKSAWPAKNGQLFLSWARGSWGGGTAAGYTVAGSTDFVITFYGGSIADTVNIQPWDIYSPSYVISKGNGLQFLHDYRGTDFATPTLDAWGGVAVSGILLCPIGWKGYGRITNFETSPVVTLIGYAPHTLQAIDSDPQTRSIGAIFYGYDDITELGVMITRDTGLTYSTLPTPPYGRYTMFIAVISREI